MFSGPRAHADASRGAGTIFSFASGAVNTIYDFFSTQTCSGDGARPDSDLLYASDGNLYGTTPEGGAFNRGTIFRMSPSGQMTILYSFGAITNDGKEPRGQLLRLPDGTMYGVTSYGGQYESGPNGGGTIYRLDPEGSYTLLHSFDNPAVIDGAFPTAGLVQGSDGNLYGTTLCGGSGTHPGNCGAGAGTVYKVVINPTGTAPSTYATPVPEPCRAIGPPGGQGGVSGGGVSTHTLLLLLTFGWLGQLRLQRSRSTVAGR